MSGAGALAPLAKQIRIDALKMIYRARSAHVGGAFSMADLLAVLYGEALRIDPAQPDDPTRDRFVLSKGHACSSLYAVLAARGFFPRELLDTFYQDGTTLAGHVTTGVPGVELSTGSLGHGLPVSVGMALALKRDGNPARVFTMLSDGECDEGSNWEAILFAPHHRLDNLTVIVDYNKIQSLGTVTEVMALEPFADKWRAFGWSVREIDGHDLSQISATLGAVPFETGRPSCVIAHTVKGKGVSFMQDLLLWHYHCPSEEELQAALEELGA